MFGWFGSKPFVDPALGELVRRRGLWRGSIDLAQEPNVPLVLAGTRDAPDSTALIVARQLPHSVASWMPSIETALFDHYGPYAESVAAAEEPPPMAGLPRIAAPTGVWSYVKTVFVSVLPLDRQLTVEIGYTVTWDEEHTLGARFQSGRFVELCGSVLAP